MSKNHKTGLPHAAPNALDRRSLLASAGMASLGIASASGMLGAFTRGALAADKVTKMGFDHPYNFVTYVSDIQRWGTRLRQGQRAYCALHLGQRQARRPDRQSGNLDIPGRQGNLLFPD